MPTTQASLFIDNPQKTVITVLVPNSCVPSVHLFVNEKLLTTLFEYPACYSVPLIFLLQIMAFCLILYFLETYTAFIYCSYTVLPALLQRFLLLWPQSASSLTTDYILPGLHSFLPLVVIW